MDGEEAEGEGSLEEALPGLQTLRGEGGVACSQQINSLGEGNAFMPPPHGGCGGGLKSSGSVSER